jgi:hypothetical protein
VLTCDAGSGATLIYGREAGDGAESIPVSFTAGTSSLWLPSVGKVTKLGPSGHEVAYFTRAIRVPPEFLEAVSQTGAFNLAEGAAASAATIERKFLADELTSPLQSLQRSCKRDISQQSSSPSR